MKVESVVSHVLFPDQNWQELVEGDVLDLSGDNLSGFFVEFIISPVTVERTECISDAIVMSDEDSVKGCYTRQNVDFIGSR